MKSQHQKTLDSFLGQTKKRASESTSQEEQTSKRQKVVQNTESNSSKKTDEFESTFISHLREPSWKEAIGSEFEKPYFKKLLQFIQERKKSGAVIFPEEANIFNAFNLTPFDKVKVVIIGQDPYHGPGQAHGLAFSVPFGVTPPPSLKNIFKELKNDLGDFSIPKHGCLEKWARQGVLLLNTVLTVEQGKPNSHQGKGWEQFTDAALKQLNAKRNGIVFLLWGAHAQKKQQYINSDKHHVLTSAHPSPMSVKGFFGCKHFSKTNAILEKEGQQPIDWRLDDWTPQLSEKTSSENKDSVTPSTTSSSQSESKQASNAHNNQKNKISDKQTKSNK